MKPHSPEALIEGLRNRRKRIILLGIASLVVCTVTAINVWLTNSMLQWRIPDDNDDILGSIMMNEAMTPMLISAIVKTYFFIGLAAFLICTFIGEITTFTKSRLLVEMWDRIQSLERRLEPAADPPMNDTAVRDGPAI